MRFPALPMFLFWWQFHEGQLAIGWSKFDLKEGQEQYAVVMDRTKHPTYGDCWLRAVEQLRTDCDCLTAGVQRRLAFRFANCFLETSGLSTYSCSEAEQDLNKCIKRMDDRGFTAYTAFFTHTANMCFFLSSQLWNHETEGTINRLVDASAIVTSGMEATLRLQQEWMENDKEHRKAVNLAMESSRVTALDLFQQIARIRETIFGELACLYTVVFYFFSSAFSFLLTSTKRTEAARFWLFCLFVSAIALEHLAVDRNLDAGVGLNLDETKDSFHLTTWFIRKASVCAAIIVLGVCIYRYRDLNRMNHQLMKDTNEQVHALNKYLIQAKMLTMATANCNGTNDIQKCNGISHRRCDPSYLPSSDDEVFSGGESERSTDYSFNEMNKIPVQRSSRTYTRRKKDSRVGILSPNYPYNLRDRNRLASPEINMLSYESPEMFSAAVHRLASSTQKQAAAFRRTLTEKRLEMQDYEH